MAGNKARWRETDLYSVPCKRRCFPSMRMLDAFSPLLLRVRSHTTMVPEVMKPTPEGKASSRLPLYRTSHAMGTRPICPSVEFTPKKAYEKAKSS